MFAMEILAARAVPTGNVTKPSTIGGDLNLLRSDWKGGAEKASGFQAV